MSALRQLISLVLAIYIACPVCCCNAEPETCESSSLPACTHCHTEAPENSGSSRDESPPKSCNCLTSGKLVSAEPIGLPKIENTDAGDPTQLDGHAHDAAVGNLLPVQGYPQSGHPPGVALRHLNCVLLL